MDFHATLGPVIFDADQRTVHEYLRDDGLLTIGVDCSHCNAGMELRPRTQEATSDGYGWQCVNTRCIAKDTFISIRSGSFFARSRGTLPKWLHAIYLWSQETSVKNSCDTLGLSRPTVIQMFQSMRNICSTKLEQEPIQLGGPGIIVQIDESLFRHKPKYHRGRPPRSEQWVFGMVDTSTSPATGYMELVEKRDAATLLPIINRIVRPGSIIHSDQWRAYNRISDTFQHEKVNHSENFVDPDTGVHTKNIESYWNKAKTRFKRMKGVAADQLESYLDEIMWRDRYGRTYEQAFANIKVQMAEQAQHN